MADDGTKTPSRHGEQSSPSGDGRLKTPVRTPRRPASVKSHSTSRSTASSQKRQLEVELEARKELKGMEASIRSKEKDMDLLEVEVCEAQQYVDECDKVLEGYDDPEEGKKVLGYQEAVKKLQDLKTKLKRAQIDVKYERQALESNKEFILEVAKLKKLEIEEEEENDSQELSESEEESDFASATGGAPSLTASDEDLEERLKRLRSDEDLSKPRTRVEQVQVTQMPLCGISAAKEEEPTASKPKSSPQDKFLARQTVGKDLPVFNGKPEEWIPFIESYRSTTEICEFSDAENMARLHKCLKGDALKLVQCWMTSPANVSEVLETLQDRYGQPERILKTLTDKVKATPPVRQDKMDTLVEFGVNLQQLVATMRSLKCEDHLNNPTLLTELEQKLHNTMKLEWREWVMDDSSRKRSLDSFAIWIKRKTKLALSLVDDSAPKPSAAENWRDKRNRPRPLFTTASKEESASGVQQKCLFCRNGGHILDVCRKFDREKLDDKWNFVKKQRLCFVCLGKGHSSTECPKDKKCERIGCHRHHHPTLHSTTTNERNRSPTERTQQTEGAAAAPAPNCSIGRTTSKELLRIFPITIKGPHKTIHTFAIADEGSSVTLLKDTVRRELGITGVVDPLSLQWIDESPKTEEDSQRISVTVSGDFQNAPSYEMTNVRTVSELKIRPQSLNVEELKREWPHLRRMKMNSMRNAVPTMLIGIKHAKLTAHREVLDGPDDAPMAVRTKLGWMVSGSDSNGRSPRPLLIVQEEADEELNKIVKDYFTVEHFGVKVQDGKQLSKEDKKALDIMEKTTYLREDGRWETGLLWKNEKPTLPESKSAAFHRLKCQERRLDKEEAFAQQYLKKVEEYLKKGYIEKLPRGAAEERSDSMWYLPHFGVFNINKPGKIRWVFDAAAVSKGTSLNSELLSGPDLLTPLQAVLWRFRETKIAFTGDISDMFHRVYVPESDRNSQRFLWRGMSRNREPDVYRMKVMIFGATSSPSSAMFVKNKNAERFRVQHSEAVAAIQNNEYMDDHLGGANSDEEAIQLLQDVIKIHREGGFEICKFASNSKAVLDSIPADLRCASAKSLEEKSDYPTERVLGMWWEAGEDVLTFRANFAKIPVEIKSGLRRPTKRDIARLVMSVYDPLGLLTPFKMKGQVLLQLTWKANIGWDTPVSDEIQKLWITWLEELPDITKVKIPRCHSSLLTGEYNLQLHVFVDASDEAYTAVTYWRIERNGEVDVSIIASKLRVAPIKPLTIPRLELQAALMGSRLAHTIRNEHRIIPSRTVMWSDSTAVLRWLRSETGRFKQFVANRVTEILEVTSVDEWRWVPSELNVADDATRSGKPCDLSSTSRWLTGPEFLRSSEEEWPAERRELLDAISKDILELKATVAIVHEVDSTSSVLPDIDRFSSWLKLLRVTALVRKLGLVWKHKCKGSISISAGDIREAEILWWKKSQQDSFSEELKMLKSGGAIDKKSRLYKLSPYLDEHGVIRISGRIDRAENLLEEAKRPVILDPKHEYTRLLMDHEHKEGAHQGQERMISVIRQRHWIIDLRAAVRSTWNRCLICRMKRAMPVVPQMGSLPQSRLQGKYPFESTGVDYFGPLTITNKRSKEKRWGVVFTCMATRAIHLEISPSLETDQMILTLMRFINRRGRPKQLNSDNGTNFRGADVELKKSLDQMNHKEIGDHLANRGIEWLFIPPGAPHMGGAWERMVGLVKKTLNAILKEQSPREFTLLTLLTEVENIVNSRPLTYASTDPADMECLTPNHFLRMKTFTGPSVPGEYEDADLILRRQWRTAQRMADHFWDRWIKEYVPTLVRRHKWHEKNPNISEGDVVIIVDNQKPRNTWMKGIITKIFPGEDGIVRAVDVKTAAGEYRRPVTKIIPLNLRSDKAGLSGGRNVPVPNQERVGEEQEDAGTPSTHKGGRRGIERGEEREQD